jgi:hypothetical protein
LAYRAGVDTCVNLKRLKVLQRSGILALYRVRKLEQKFRNVVEQAGPFRLGTSELGGPDMLAGEEFQEALRIIGSRPDAVHLYACHLNHCDYFVTDNRKDFIDHGRRDKLEALLGVKIRRTDEILKEFELASSA